jgi:bifunctional ADP-heptose synthase (sugar kinase/adenylyltransferase)
MNEVQIVGESCVDVYIYGRCPRLSPEAPVPVFIQDRIERAPGMAGNVKANLMALGVGGPLLTQEQAITKTRYVEETRNHCLLRVDDDPPCTPFDWIIDLETPVVLVDYNKGFLVAEDIEKASLPPWSFLDTKKPLGSWCKGISYIKVNEHEFKASEAFVRANPWMQEKLIVTLGECGALWNGHHFPTDKQQVLDVTGAGDTFFAAFVAKFLKTLDVPSAITFANHCASYVVTRRGTSVLPEKAKELL